LAVPVGVPVGVGVGVGTTTKHHKNTTKRNTNIIMFFDAVTYT
jgi:hypothetical protein